MHPLALLSLVVALAWAGSAGAQSAPAAAASSPSDRAQRDADKVYRMILMHADKPRRPAARDEKAVVPATGSAAVRPAPVARPSAETAAVAVKPADPAVAAPTATPAPAETTPTVASGAVETPLAVSTPTPTTTSPVAPSVPASTEPVAAIAKNTKLELVQSEEPAFPSRLVRQLGSGSVIVRFDVRPDGTVSQPEVVQSSHRGLNAAALTAVAAWRFKPITEAAPGIVELKFE